MFPKPPDFAKLNAFDLAYLAQHPEFTLFLFTLLAVAGLAGFALLSVRVKAFWERVRQGLTILQDRERYIREVFLVQLGGWCFRFAAFWMLLEAFNVGGSVKNVLLVLGVNAVSAAVRFTPQSAGVQQLCSRRCSPARPGRRGVSRSASRSDGARHVRHRVRSIVSSSSTQLQGGIARQGGPGYVPKPSRASRTRMTASGKSVCIAARSS